MSTGQQASDAQADHRLESDFSLSPDLLTFLDSTFDGVIVADTEGRIVEMNKVAESMFGISLEQIRGETLGDVIVPTHLRDRHEAGMARMRKDPNPRLSGKRLQTDGRRADGTNFPLELTLTSLRLGGKLLVAAHMRDLSRERDTERMLRESEARFRLAVRGAHDGIFEWDLTNGRHHYSEHCLKIFGISPGDLGDAVDAWQRFIVDEDRRKVREATMRLLDGAADTVEMEYRIRRPDGEIRWLHSTAAAERRPDGRVTRIAGSTGDITERKSIERALLESERRFRTIAEAHPIPVLIYREADGHILYASPGTEALFGLPVFRLIDLPFSDLFNGPEAARDFTGRVSRESALTGARAQMRAAGRGVFPVSLNARAFVHDGQPAVLVSVNDLTESERTAQELERQRERLAQNEKLAALGSMLAGVAHELNNPLSILLGQSAMLMEEVPQDYRPRAEKIERAADRCARIVRSFLAIARQRPAERRPADLRAIAMGAVEMLEEDMDATGIERTIHMSPILPGILGDADQLQQVVSNLITNAVQALADRPAPRRLMITCAPSPDGRAALLEVSDNGGGIPDDLRRRIFEPFFTTKPLGMGTGIGLAVSLGIVEAHGGRLQLAEPRLGGATFRLSLPIG